MQDASKIPIGVEEAAGAGLPPDEPEALQSVRIQGPPACWRRMRAIKTPPVQLGAHAGSATSGGSATYTSSSMCAR
eukprot:7733058-Alexandrium_andersonii.AAC.1